MIKTCIHCVLTLLCAVMMETAILSNITALPSVPDLLLLCCVFIALLNGPTFGCVMSFVAGMMLDCAAGSPLGYNALVRVIIGFAAGYVGRAIYFDGAFLPIVIGAASIMAKWLIIMVMSVLFPAVRMLDIRSTTFIFDLGVTSVLSPFIFAFLRLFSNLLSVPAPLGRKEEGTAR